MKTNGNAESASGLSVVALIPALNEEASLPLTLEALSRVGVREVVVADNGSQDSTCDVARGLGAAVVVEPRRGYGSACQAGLRFLDSRPAGVPGAVLFVDADHGLHPAPLEAVLAPVRAGAAELVVGARQGRGDAPGRQRLGTTLVARLARVVHGAELADLGPLRAVTWRALARMELDDPDWGWTLQMQLRAHHLGIRTLEVPVERTPRPAGHSKISGSLHISMLVGMRMLAVLMAERRRNR
jgi:glycosyltransferase involved in cell wall biosynthesis